MHHLFAIRKLLMPQQRPQLYWTEAIHQHHPKDQ
jgi:hypothetical protein